MLHLHQSNSVERLADGLAALLAAPATSGPFAPETVMVQSAGMGRWLQLALAERLGVCANVEFPFPAAFVWRLLRGTLPELPHTSPFDPDVLAWRLLRLLDDVPAAGEEWAPLRHWLAGADARGRYDLARRLAATFDRYLVYRPEWIEAWEAGRDGPTAPHAGWQRALWRRLAAEAGGAAHWVAVRRAFDNAAAEGKVAEQVAAGALPARVALFGVPSLSPGFLEVLALFADAAEVHVFFANPCREYWGDIRTEADRARLAERDPAEAMYVETGHPLLASLGRQGRDLLDLLLEYSPHEHDGFEEPGEATWLARLQGDLLALREHGEGGTAPPVVVDAADGSIEVHACHSPLREVEVLRDRLRDLFEREPALDPSDVVVMAPDIERYAAAVEAVFGAEPPARRIDYRIADRPFAGETPLVEGFFALLESARGRHDAAGVLGLLDSPALRRRFDLNEAAVERVHAWTAAVRVRWGIDAGERAALGLPAESAHTWREGLDRLLLGHALSGEGERLFAGLLPADDVEGGDARLLGRFARFAEALFELPELLAAERPPGAWARLLGQQFERFFAVDEDDAEDAQRLRAAIDEVARLAESGGYDAPLPLDVVLAALRENTGGGGGVHRFLAGGVTFCTLTPMRGIPFEVVCLLGMDDGAFPRPERRADFDLSQQRFRRGDRSRRADDRYLFLELLLGARRRLWLSHVGQDIRENSPLPPSVLIAELLDCLDRSFVLSPAARERLQATGVASPVARDLLLVRHPLQAFSRRYFDGSDPRLWSYDGQLCAALDARGSAEVEPLLPAPLPEPGEEWLDIDLATLSAFFEHPARFLLSRRLGVRLPAAEGEAEDAEPFDVAGLERWQLRGTLVRAALAGEPGHGLAVARAAGMLPHGRVGELVGDSELAGARAFAARLAPDLAEPMLPAPVTLTLHAHGVRLRAALADVRADGRFEYRHGKLRGRQFVALWVRHLALCAAAPAGVTLRSRFRDDEDMVTLLPLEPERACEALRGLLALYRSGLCEPLAFFPQCAWQYLLAEADGKDPEGAASKAWFGNEFPLIPGEGDDPWFALACRDGGGPDTGFSTMVHTVFADLDWRREQL